MQIDKKLYLQKNKYDKTTNTHKEIESINKNRMKLLEIYRENKDKYAAKEILQIISKYSEGTTGIHFIKAVISIENNQHKTAIEYLRYCIKKNINDTLSYVLLADTLIKLNRPFETVKLLTEALKPCENHHRLSNSLGIALRCTGKNEEAANYFLQATSKNPHFKPAFINLINLYQDTKQYENAIKTLQKFLFITNNKYKKMREIGYCYLKLGKIVEAIFWYQRASATKIKISL